MADTCRRDVGTNGGAFAVRGRFRGAGLGAGRSGAFTLTLASIRALADAVCAGADGRIALGFRGNRGRITTPVCGSTELPVVSSARSSLPKSCSLNAIFSTVPVTSLVCAGWGAGTGAIGGVVRGGSSVATACAADSGGAPGDGGSELAGVVPGVELEYVSTRSMFSHFRSVACEFL